MTTLEETRVLRYLSTHTPASLNDILRSCLPGASPDLGKRVISDLEWLGYVTVYYSGGDPVALEITPKGLGHP